MSSTTDRRAVLAALTGSPAVLGLAGDIDVALRDRAIQGVAAPVAMTLFTPSFVPALDSQAKLVPNARLYFHHSGGRQEARVYTDAACTRAHPNPVVADRAGRFPPIYLFAATRYRATLIDPVTGVALSDVDPVGDMLAADLAQGDGPRQIGFQQEGAHAVKRTVLDKLRETLSVKDFGAIGDGVTDDTDAFQAALEALAGATHRHLHVAPGCYAISRTLRVPSTLTSAEIVGASGYDGVRGPINSGLATSLKWIGPAAPASAMVRFDRSSGTRWAGISLDCAHKAGYGVQFMSGDAGTGCVKNIVEAASIHYAARDGIIVGESGPPTAGPGGRQFFGNVFRNLTFYGCRRSAIHINEWNADQQLFDTVMVYFDDTARPQACDNAFWFDHGGQWSMVMNCQSGGMTVDPAVPSSGYMIRNQASDSTTGGAFGLTVVNAWQEGAGGLYYGVTSTNDNKAFNFVSCASFTSDPAQPSVFIDKGTSTRIAYTFVGCSFMSDVRIATPAVLKNDIALVNCSFAPGKGMVDAHGTRTVDGCHQATAGKEGRLVLPRFADTHFCTLTGPANSLHIEGAAPAGDRIAIIVTQDEAGRRPIDWGASSGFASQPRIPQPAPGAGAATSYSFVSNGSAYVLVSCAGAA